ncbi:MAG: hypothetical protein V3U45_08330 [bacterium]
MKVAVTRSWAKEKYGSYRVTFEEEVPLQEPEGMSPAEVGSQYQRQIREATDALAWEALLAKDRYDKIQEEWASGGGTFRSAKEVLLRESDAIREGIVEAQAETARGQEADQPTQGASTGPEPAGTSSHGSPFATPSQIEAVEALSAKSEWHEKQVGITLKKAGSREIKDLTAEEASSLIGALNRGKQPASSVASGTG